jgi:hypothetical protein
MKVTKRPPCYILALITLITSIVLSDCEILQFDFFPTYLTQEMKFVNLKDAIPGFSSTLPLNIEKFTFLSSDFNSTLYVKISDISQNSILALDMKTLLVKKRYTDIPMGFLLTDMQGYYVSGSDSLLVRIDSESLETIDSPAINYYPGASMNALGFSTGIGTPMATTYLIWLTKEEDESYKIHLGTYTDWDTGTSQTVPFSSDTSYSNITLDSVLYDGTFIQIFVNDHATQNGLLITFNSQASFEQAFSSDATFLEAASGSAGSSCTISLYNSDWDTAWLTSSGLIVLYHSGRRRFQRYDRFTGNEIDSFYPGELDSINCGFSPDGKCWILYEKKTDKLHLLRTWW